MAFESGTAYPESDADDEFEYERSLNDRSSVLGEDSEASPTDSEGPSSNEHTPTTYGAQSSGDRLPETIISEWTENECADFVSTLGLRQYADQFLGTRPRVNLITARELTCTRKRNCRRGLSSSTA
jgi:hypothetical protein